MPNKDKTKRVYRANSYRYDESSPNSDIRNASDHVMEDKFDSRMKFGGVGPERIADYVPRVTETYRFIANKDKERGTGSSSARRIVK